jgi:cyclopropane fatty-acyl-phospholipid synthase-like methyltransferase
LLNKNIGEKGGSMESHYNEKYFFAEKTGGVLYTDSAGKSREFGYRQGGIWNFQALLDKLIELLGLPETILDAGCGCGGFPATANNNGIKSVGLEFSQYAIDHAILGAEKCIVKGDVEQTPWTVEGQYDWISFIDVFEHLFADTIDQVIAEAKKRARKYIIAKICTAQLPREVWSAKRAPYEEVIAQAKREGFEWLVASGHVCCEMPQFWIDKFVDSNWVLREDLSERLRRELHLPEDWRTTIILENISQKNVEVASPMPTTFTNEYYDENYFVTPKGKKFRTSPQHLDGWSYANPEGEYLGCKDIAKAWKTIFNPEKMLDFGCGRGTFLTYCRDIGVNAVGFDYSEYAVKNPYVRCKPEWVKQHDATKPWPYMDNSFDFVTVLDLFEHIYYDDLPKVIHEMYRVANKWIFIQTAVSGGNGGSHGGEDKEGYILKKGEQLPIEREKYSVAGHVTLMNEAAWETILDDARWMRRRDMEIWFKTLVPQDAISNWLKNSVIILEKVA